MKVAICKAALAVLAGFIGIEAYAQVGSKNFSEGWAAITTQADPFNTESVDIAQIFKDGFTFRCGELNMKGDSYGFESLSFNAEIRFVIDGGAPQSRTGKYSTYLGGSDLITDSRYYSFKITNDDMEALQRGTTIQVAGKFGTSGWETKSLSLLGFTPAYSEMCQ